jgi:hypothetical protein
VAFAGEVEGRACSTELRGEADGVEPGDGVYVGGGTNEAFLFPPGLVGVFPESNAACKSEAYLSWKDRLWLISIATARSSAAIPSTDGLG